MTNSISHTTSFANRGSAFGSFFRTAPELIEYELMLEHLHPDFSRKLVSSAPNLTPMEIQVCTLTRLHLRTKEAAELLKITPSSVETHRSNARHKLGMNRTQKLTSVLHAL